MLVCMCVCVCAHMCGVGVGVGGWEMGMHACVHVYILYVRVWGHMFRGAFLSVQYISSCLFVLVYVHLYMHTYVRNVHVYVCPCVCAYNV